MEHYEERTLTKEQIVDFLDRVLEYADDIPMDYNNVKSTWSPLSRFFDHYIPILDPISLYRWFLRNTWNNLPDDEDMFDESNQLLLFETREPKKLFSLYVSRCGCCGEMLLENDRGEALSEYGRVMNICWSDEYSLRGEGILLCKGCYESESMHPPPYDIEIYEGSCTEPSSTGYVGNYISHIEEVYDEVTDFMYIDEEKEDLFVDSKTTVDICETYNICFQDLKERAEFVPLPEEVTLLVINNEDMIILKQVHNIFDKWYYDMQKCYSCPLYLEPEELCTIGGICIELPGYNPKELSVEDYITKKSTLI